jgi:hypothetical protein
LIESGSTACWGPDDHYSEDVWFENGRKSYQNIFDDICLQFSFLIILWIQTSDKNTVYYIQKNPIPGLCHASGALMLTAADLSRLLTRAQALKQVSFSLTKTMQKVVVDFKLYPSRKDE